MTDQELADKVVALGVARYIDGGYWLISADSTIAYPTHQFLSDWRVAGALMEKMRGKLEAMIACDQIDYLRKDASLPREIIEACVQRLS